MDHSRSRCQEFRSMMLRASTKVASRGVAVALAGAVPATISAQQLATAAAPLVFDSVTVVDVEHGKLVADQRVVIVGNRVHTVGSSRTVSIPRTAQVVDAKGKYLIPGLWDMHTHAAREADIMYPLFLAHGITGIRDAGSPVPLDTLLLWRRAILNGTRVGPPRQLLSGQSITVHPRDTCDRSVLQDKLQTCVKDSADAVRFIDSLKAAGADMLKPRDIYPPLYYIIAAEARRVGLPFGGHAWDPLALESSDSGAVLIDHLQPYGDNGRVKGGFRERCWGGAWPGRAAIDIDACRWVTEKFTRHNTWGVPTLVTDPSLLSDRSKSIMRGLAARLAAFNAGPLSHENWLRDAAAASSASPDSLGVLHVMQRAGLPIVAGTDTYDPARIPPFSFQAELAMYVAEGLTTLGALQSATLNPAKFWRATDSLGTVASGKLADLVLLDADPLTDITNTTLVRAVVANGRYFDRTALDQLLAEAQTLLKTKPDPKRRSTP